MEIAMRLTISESKPPVANNVCQIAETDWRSTAASVEAALAHVTFTTREIEGVLALDDQGWHSIGGGNDE
jgi:hypothetical protein